MTKPNIFITGSPGSGKTTLAKALAETLGMRHVNVASEIRERKLYTEWDDEYDAAIYDEDMVEEFLEQECAQGGAVIDFHSVELMNEKWFSLIVILKVDTAVLWDRLAARGYPEAKVQENVQCEIFNSFKIDLMEAWEVEDEADFPVPLMELASDENEQINHNVQSIVQALREKNLIE